ncbi:MAG: DUF2029 domain-containing protein [Chloroflexi bacterium]|nr:MAG: DUF2029 domain-containing protein [Chloroflexota bacterium]
MRWRNLAYLGALSLCLEIAAGEVAFWIQNALLTPLRGPDFYIYYASSLQLLRSGPGSAYDLAYVLLPQILPPWVTLAFYPLGLLPFRAAYLAWGATILVLVAAAILVLVRAAGLRGRSAVLASAAAAASLPLFVLLVQGQSDAPMLLALAAAGLAWVRRRPAWAGAFAALALVKPQLMVLVPALFLVRRSWPALGAFAGVAAGLALVSLLVFGLRACLDWLSIVAPWAVSGGGGYSVNAQSTYSLRGLLQLLPLPAGVQVVVVAAGLLAVAFVMLRTRADPRLQFALAVAGSVALSLYQHAHDLSLLVVPGLLLAGALPALRRPRLGAALLAGGWLALELLIMAPAVTALAIVALTVFLAWECWGDRPAPVSEPNALPLAA